MTLEEMRVAVVGELEKVWHELTGTVDVDRARQVIADSAATLTAHVSALGQHLFDHVLGNAESQTGNPAVDVPVPTGPATGGLVSGPGPVLIGESGPETLVLPQGTDVVDQMADGGHVAGDSNPDTVDEPSQGS